MNELVKYFKNKYTDVITEFDEISLTKLAKFIRVYNLLEKDNDYFLIEKLNLKDLKKDLKFIGDEKLFNKYLREEKLKRILDENISSDDNITT